MFLRTSCKTQDSQISVESTEVWNDIACKMAINERLPHGGAYILHHTNIIVSNFLARRLSASPRADLCACKQKVRISSLRPADSQVIPFDKKFADQPINNDDLVPNSM